MQQKFVKNFTLLLAGEGNFMKKSIILLCLSFVSAYLFSVKTNENLTIIQPEIFGIHPEKATVGDIVTIYGKNFSKRDDGDEILFENTQCRDYDFDYVYWSHDIIIVKVPTGARSGKILIKKQDIFYEGPEIAIGNQDSHIYTEPMELTIDYSVFIKPDQDADENPLYMWLPSAIPSDKQRDVTLLETSYNHYERQENELDLFKINGFQHANKYSFRKKFSFTNYQLETKINADDVSDDYNTADEFYTYYTSPQYAVESDNPRMIKLAKEIVGNEKNPYKKARLIYDWVVDNMDYQYPPPRRDWKAISALNTRRGDCAVYSFLFSALCRAVGVPARPVAGHVLFVNDVVSMHFWAEFFIPHYGWIPVDANYGDVQVAGFKPKDFYFGNMDNRHIAFSKGRVKYVLPGEIWGSPKEYILKFLQKYHLYMKNRPEGVNFNIERSICRVLEED